MSTALFGNLPLTVYGSSRLRISSDTSDRLSGPKVSWWASCSACWHAPRMSGFSQHSSELNSVFQGLCSTSLSQSSHTCAVTLGLRCNSRWAARRRRVSCAIPSFSMEMLILKSAALERENPSPRPPGPANRSITGMVICRGYWTSPELSISLMCRDKVREEPAVVLPGEFQLLCHKVASLLTQFVKSSLSRDTIAEEFCAGPWHGQNNPFMHRPSAA